MKFSDSIIILTNYCLLEDLKQEEVKSSAFNIIHKNMGMIVRSEGKGRKNTYGQKRSMSHREKSIQCPSVPGFPK